jgi:hypothetical protein
VKLTGWDSAIKRASYPEGYLIKPGVLRPPVASKAIRYTEGVKWHIQTQALMIVHGGHGTNCAMA